MSAHDQESSEAGISPTLDLNVATNDLRNSRVLITDEACLGIYGLAMSPDGRALAFVRGGCEDGNGGEFWTIGTDGLFESTYEGGFRAATNPTWAQPR